MRPTRNRRSRFFCAARHWPKVCYVDSNELRENDDGMRHRDRRGVVRSLERGSSEVFYWELFVFRRPFIFLQRRKLDVSTLVC